MLSPEKGKELAKKLGGTDEEGRALSQNGLRKGIHSPHFIYSDCFFLSFVVFDTAIQVAFEDQHLSTKPKVSKFKSFFIKPVNIGLPKKGIFAGTKVVICNYFSPFRSLWKRSFYFFCSCSCCLSYLWGMIPRLFFFLFFFQCGYFRLKHAATLLDGRMYIIGGGTEEGKNNNVVLVYDTSKCFSFLLPPGFLFSEFHF